MLARNSSIKPPIKHQQTNPTTSLNKKKESKKPPKNIRKETS